MTPEELDRLATHCDNALAAYKASNGIGEVVIHYSDLRELIAAARELHRYKCAMVLDADKHLSPDTVSAELAMAIIDRDEAIKRAENEKIEHGVTVEMLTRAQMERDAAIRRLAEAIGERNAAMQRSAELHAERDAARAVLREHEWCEEELSNYGCSSDRYCQHCGARKGEGNRPDDEHGKNHCAWKRAMGES